MTEDREENPGTTSIESKSYALLGASSSKHAVHKAVAADTRFFASLSQDVCGNKDYFSLLHADGAGTKSLVAYLCYRETGETHWFRSLATDSLAMNLDDVACVGAFESLALSNTIGRNLKLIPDEAIAEIIRGYREQIEELRSLGIDIQFTGGETADLGDLVRTLVVDSTLFARVKRSAAISLEQVVDGDVLVGFASAYERDGVLNSGLGSNGYTLARHALISREYLQKYPEIGDPGVPLEEAYRGQTALFDNLGDSNMSVAEALLSPTRIYTPAVAAICSSLSGKIHGLIHCTGGGQTKNVRFGPGVRYVKDSLFEVPDVFLAVQRSMGVPWSEMYAVFNMGHRLEVVCPSSASAEVIQIAREYGIEAKQVGHVEKSESGVNEVVVDGPFGRFSYSA